MITDLLMRTLESRNRKPRYVGGRTAMPILFLRRWLSDRMFDQVAMASFTQGAGIVGAHCATGKLASDSEL